METCKKCLDERSKMTLSERASIIKGTVWYRGENHIVTKFTNTEIETLCGIESLEEWKD